MSEHPQSLRAVLSEIGSAISNASYVLDFALDDPTGTERQAGAICAVRSLLDAASLKLEALTTRLDREARP